jgi:aspartate carbamoyltransferase regulatory subunit
MNEIISQLLPNTEVILSSNVKGCEKLSKVKDVIKIFGDINWNLELDNLVSLFSDTSINKSCRVSKFKDGKRIEKWTFRENFNNNNCCKNENCITNDKLFQESIVFHFTKRKDDRLECPFCHFIQ